MKRKPNYLKHLLQWGVLAAIAGTVLWAQLSDKPVDVEAYCPFGGLQAFGTYVVNNSLACSMSMLQIMMGLVLAVGVILFSKLFCGYLGALGVANAWVWTIGGACLAAYIVEIAKMRSCTFPLMYIRRDLNTCNNCGLCEKKCPYQLPIHDYVKVKHVDCTLCGNCIGACAKDALQVNGRRSLRWVPGLLAVVLFFLAIWLGSTMELPTEFACPVDVTVYVDPAAGITEKMFGEAIDAKELIIPAKEGEKVIPMHTVLKTYAVAGQVSREEFAQVMFRDVEKLAGRFVANLEKWGDDEQFPKAVYEMVFPGIEKMPIRNAFPYFKSFLSCTDGIVSVDFVLRDMKPVMRIHYVKSMWDDAKLWKEVFQTEKWTLRMADGTFKEADPRLKFTNPGKTVGE